MKKRYTVLTYIINAYEEVHEIDVCDPEAEYILVTDDKELHSNTWRVVYDADLEGLSVFDKCYAIRFNCFKYVTTDICVRLDGSIRVMAPLSPLIDIFEQGGYDVGLMPHPLRCNFKEEYDVWVKQRGYPRKQARYCIDTLRDLGYDFSYKGMFQGCMSIQRRGSLTDSIDSQTLALMKQLGKAGQIERLDQIPLSFIVNTRFSHLRVLPISERILMSYALQWYAHNSDQPCFNVLPDADRAWMFNREVTCASLPTLPEYMVRRERFLQDLVMDEKQQIIRLQRRRDSHLRSIRLLVVLSSILVLVSLILSMALLA